MNKSAFFAWILRMPLIKRWAVMHLVKGENVAEHSHQVAVISHMLAVIRNTYFGGSINPEKAATVALYHEVSESKLQDVIHVTKYHNPAIAREFKVIEELAERECLATLPAELQPLFDGLLIQNNVDPEYKQIVKAADIIAAYLKACDEIKFNNPEFYTVKIRLEEMINDLKGKFPEVAMFMDVFAERSLDSIESPPIK
ncbi:MAG: 5'-deoxynucleotidase [Rheinheimera sp.]